VSKLVNQLFTFISFDPKSTGNIGFSRAKSDSRDAVKRRRDLYEEFHAKYSQLDQSLQYLRKLIVERLGPTDLPVFPPVFARPIENIADNEKKRAVLAIDFVEEKNALAAYIGRSFKRVPLPSLP
jgi:hypothetical protein